MSTAHRTMLVMGGSAGAFEALSIILPALPRDFGLPVVVALHVPPDRPSGISELLATKCTIAIKEAEDKEPLKAGTVYFAPSNYHLLVEATRSLALSIDPPVYFSRPSIDVLFHSAAESIGNGAVAVLLSGANQDGAEGLAAIGRAGGTVFVQQPDSATADAMPRAGLDACPNALSMTPVDIASSLRRMSCGTELC